MSALAIWNFIYVVRPPDTEQIGLLNAIIVNLGTPRFWPAHTAIAPWNNLFLVIIVAWLQSGYAMVLFSAAIKRRPRRDP